MTEGVLATLDGRNIDVALKVRVVPGCETTLERVIASAIDLTLLKQAEKQMKRLNEELDRRVKERTAQLETAISELKAFSYSVSHDLRAPLRAMDGFSSKMLEAYCDNLDKKGVHYLERIRAAAQRMGTMIDDLLRLSRIERAEVTCELVDMTSMAREIAEELRSTDESRQAEFVIEDDLAANADKGLLRCALENLMGNAWKFSKKCQHARIEVASQRKGKNTVYFVRDNGVGFDMKHSGNLFVPFHRLHTQNEFEGSGVGLATAYRIIKRHGGEIWAESSPEQGATFYFTVSPDKSSDV
jgi:light-regulated signal transduction histidine kinase (bacteriophytochrome)